MNDFIELVQNNDTLWSSEKEEKIMNVLLNWETGQKRGRDDYYYKKTYEIKEFGGIKRVYSIETQKVFATKENALSIIRDIHVFTNHKGNRKTHTKISESYANIPRILVSLISTVVTKISTFQN